MNISQQLENPTLVSTLKQTGVKQTEEIRGALLLSVLRFQTQAHDSFYEQELFFDSLNEMADLLDAEINYEEPQSPIMASQPDHVYKMRMDLDCSTLPPSFAGRQAWVKRKRNSHTFGSNGVGFGRRASLGGTLCR